MRPDFSLQRRRCLDIVLLVLLSVREAAAFGLEAHRRSAQAAFQEAQTMLEDCDAEDEMHVEVGKSALAIICDARPVFLRYLHALRHLMALVGASAPAREACLPLVGELDVELSSLIDAGLYQRYFYWHGPKRHVFAKVKEVLSCPYVEEEEERQVEYLLHSETSLHAVETSENRLGLLGLSYPELPKPIKGDYFHNIAIRVHLAEADACSAGAMAMDLFVNNLVIAGEAASSHFETCFDQSLTIVWDLGGSFDALFAASQEPLEVAVEQALKALNRTAIDVLALPARVWTDKKVKEYAKLSLQKLNATGKVMNLSLSGPISSKHLEMILKQDQIIKPKMWYAPHDDCMPIMPDQLRVADLYGLPILAYAMPCDSVLLQIVALREGLHPHVLLARWAGELGMHAVLDESVEKLRDELHNLRYANRLSLASWKELSALPIFALPASMASSTEAFVDTFNLRPTLRLATELAKVGFEQKSNSTSTTSSPLRSGLWASIEEDRTHFENNNFLIYKEDFLSEELYAQVQEDVARLWRSTDLEPNCNLDGQSRTGGYVIDVREELLYRVFFGSEEFRRWVSQINGHLMFPSDFPIELREYPTGSKGLPCHRDTAMYRNPTLSLEVVYTIENTGMAVTSFKDKAGEETLLLPRGNSLMMVRPNAALHCVKPVREGHRTILKFIFTGDFNKSPQFDDYKNNSCGVDHRNVRVMMERRNQSAKKQSDASGTTKQGVQERARRRHDEL